MTWRAATFLISTAIVLSLTSPGDVGAQGTASAVDPIAAAASAAIGDLNYLGVDFAEDGSLLAAAEVLLAAPETVAQILRVLDANGDGALTFAEALDADLLAAARVVEQLSPVQGPPDVTPIGEDAAVTSIVQAFLGGLGDFLQLGIGNEVVLPAVPIEEMEGDPGAFLAGVPDVSLRTLADLVADLDTRAFPEGDMAASRMTVNDRRKAVLMAGMDRVVRNLGAERFRAVRRQLAWLRARADGRQRPPDWIAGPAADRIAASVDRLIALLPE